MSTEKTIFLQRKIERKETALGNNLKRLRLERGWTQFKLAELSSVPQPTISRIEAGMHHDVSAKNVMHLADALRVTMNDLMKINEKTFPGTHPKIWGHLA